MGNKNPKEAVVLSEINQAELRRAKAVMRDPVFMDWVQKFREKYIVNGFLIPVYMSGGRMFIAELRVKQFGDYILPWEMYDRVFYENPKAWIRAEDTWFWTYLMLGQKILIPKMGIPEKYKVRGMPAKGIAREIRVIAKQLKLSDSDGGGILRSPQDLADDYLAKTESTTEWTEGDDGYLEPDNIPAAPRWINKFHLYSKQELDLRIETRPCWYHLLRYAFYNLPIERLAVFYSALFSDGRVDRISFPTPDLSGQAREYIAQEIFQFPQHIQKQTEDFSRKTETRDMVCWLWYNVGHKIQKKKLSYNEIVKFSGIARGNVRESIYRFSQRLECGLDGPSLGQLLRVASTLSLGPNQIYNVLVEKGLVPPREWEIDGFDDLDRLI